MPSSCYFWGLKRDRFLLHCQKREEWLFLFIGIFGPETNSVSPAEESVLLRGVTTGTKMLSGCALHYGRNVITEILQEPLDKLIRTNGLSMEVDPLRLSGNSANSITNNRQNLRYFTATVLSRVFDYKFWPRYVMCPPTNPNISLSFFWGGGGEEQFPNLAHKHILDRWLGSVRPWR